MLAATHCLHKGLPPGVFDPVEVLALYLGALGHDAGHFRLNNAFLKNSKHALYKKYRESVLENFHLGLVFELLEDEHCGIMEFLEEADKGRFRELVTTLILATDMAKHMGLFKQLQAFLADARARHRELNWMHDSTRSDESEVQNGSAAGDGDGDAASDAGSVARSSREATPRSSANLELGESRTARVSDRDGAHESWVRPSIDGADPTQRVLVMQLLLKCADLGNVVRPLEIADAWGKRIMEEFYQQGEKELTLGLPLTTFPNRKNFDYIFARHQNGFLVNVVRPLFDVFTSLCDFDTRESVIAAASENGAAWTRRENAHRPREKGRAPAGAETESTNVKKESTQTGILTNKPGSLARQSTMGWVQEFKQSNLTMLTANAMEMKGLHLTLDFEYGADDECASAVRSLVPYVSRGELARLGRLGMLEPDPEDAEDAGTSASFAEKLAATQTFDAAVVVATFDGFLDLERSVEAGAEAEARASKKEAREKQAERFAEAAAAFGAALSGVLAKAVDSVHASGGDVVHMGHDGIVCVFPLSGGGDERTRETRLDGRDKKGQESGKISEKSAAALRAARCAFTLVSQLSSAAPELSPVGAPDGGASRAHLWPGLRAFSRGTRVMVVESLQLSRMGMGRLLDHFGCMTHFAENASQAAAACANMEFDVILMNVLLPVKDGYELSRHIRAHGGPVNGRAYIAAVTYVQQPELLDQCVAAGMNEVIVKPATMSSLRLMFRRAKRRAREMKMQDAMRQHSFSSTESGGKAASRQNSENGRGTGTRGAGRRDKELVANPYSLSGTRSKKSAKRKPNGAGGNAARPRLGGPDEDARASLDDGGGSANLADVRLSLGSGQLPSLVESDLTRGANEKCVPVHLPRYSDMLISASGGPDAARRRRASGLGGRSVDDGAVGASTAPGGAGKQTGALARFWRALCGYDVGFDGGPDARAVERAALHERSTSFASGARLSAGARAGRLSSDDGSGTADSGGAKGFDKVGISLVRYKSSGNGSAPDRDPDPTEGPEDGSDDEADLYDADDETLDETSPLPVTIAVSAAVGFGRVATIRVGTSCGAALEDVRRDADASAPWDTLDGGTGGSGGALPELAEPAGGGAGGSGSAGSTPERRFPAARDAETKKPQGETRAAKPGCPVTRRVMLSADRDVVVATDAPVPGAPPRDACEAATAAAAGGSGEGGPFQQAATLIRVATAGDVALSPAAWRLVRENCEGDTPPVLRGGARLNRIRVHEVVPPLTNHPLAPRELAATVPSSPDPRRALAALAALVPRPVRAALAARAAASAAALARRRDRRDAGFDESDEDAEEEEESGDGVHSQTSRSSESPSDKALRRLSMPHVAPRAAEAVSAVVYLPGPSRGAGRVWGDANALAQTIASAAAACVGLLQRFPHGSLTRVGSDALFSRDVDKRTGGGGGGGDGIVLHCDFSPPLPKPAEGGVASSEPQASNAPETSLSERRAAAAAAATAFALAARAAMAHLGHAGASVGVASGRSVSMAAGAVERRCEWTVTGDVVSRAERLAAFADAEVLCDLLVVKQCASSGIIDFDPVPHAAGNDVVCARNLSAGNLDRIVRAAGGSRGVRGAGSSDAPFFAEGGVNFSGDFASSSLLGRTELTERGSVAGDGVAPGPCVLMPQGTRENFGDASAKQRTAREKRLESEKEAKRPEDGNGPADKEDKEEDAAARRAAEAEAKEATGRLSYGALAALSLASASQATTQTLRALWDPGRLPAPPPLVAHETTLLAAKRVIAEAQEAMAPRLLFLSGPARAGKTRAAAAVLDLPEARRMWLLRTRGAHAVDEAVREDPHAGGGSSIMSGGSFALASFQRLFHQLLGFSPEATSRERKAAVVALLEGCGEERERLGRYAKPILEILGIEKADEGAEDAEEDALVSDRWSEWSGGTLRSGGSGGKSSARGGASPEASTSQNARANTHDALATPRAKAKGSLRGERSTRGGGGGGGGGLSLDSESSPGADEKSAEAEGGVERGASGGVGARRKPSRQASRLGLARDRSEASTIGGGEKGESREGRERLGLGGFLDAVSAAAMKDATRHLCPSAMDALLGDGVGVDHPGCEGPSRRDGVTGGEDEHQDEHHEHHEHSDASSEAKIARAVIMGRLSGAVAFTRQLNGVQRRDHNKRFRAVAQRRKNTLESILVSTNGASRLCETMALMLERLLLGRATQAAPAQPSLPGWILLVEDAHWLDPFSMGLIRALLDRCSIPLAIVMTHVSGRDGLETADADRTDSGLNAKTRNDARAYTRADESVHDVDESAHGGAVFGSPPGPEPGDASFQKIFSENVSAGRADVWGAGVGLSTTRVEAMDHKRWLRKDLDWMLEMYSTTVVDVAPLSRSDLRVFVEECASRALRGEPRASAGAGETLAGTSSSSEVDTSGRDSEKGASDTKDERSVAADTKDKTARAVRRAGGGARSVGLPSAVHAELYKNTGGDPLHAATLANLLVSCGAVSVIQKGVGGVPEVVFKAEPEPGAAATNEGLSSAAVARMHARDAAMESLERRLSADAFSALKTLAASGGRVRAAQAHALVARRLATRDKERLEKRDSMASVFRREFVSNLAVGIDDAGSMALAPPRPSSDADDEKEGGKTTAEHVADPRAVALAYGAARCASRASAAIVELVKAGVLAADWGALEDARAASEAAFAEAAVAFAVADVPFPLRGDFSAKEHDSGEILKVSDVHAEDGTPTLREHGGGSREVRASLPRSSPSASVSGRNLRVASETERRRRKTGTRASAWSAAQRVPWLVFANDDVRAYAYESQAAWRRRAAHLDATRALRDEVQYCVGDDVATTALVFELAARHIAQAQMVDRVALAAYAAAGEARRLAAAAVDATTSQVSFPENPGTNPTRVSFDGPSAGTAAAVAAERALGARVVSGVAQGLAGAGPDPSISPREILLAASGLWQRVRFHEAITAAHVRRGTIRSAILSASALSLAAAAWADLSKDMHRAFGKRHPRLVEHVALASEDGKNLLVRNAAWSLTLSRLVLDLGDVAPPFLTSESALARDRRSPLHHARRACICVDVKWPFDAALVSAAALASAEIAAARDALDVLPSAFLRNRLVDGLRDDFFDEARDLNGNDGVLRNDSVRIRNENGGSFFGACFGGAGAGARARERAVAGVHGLDAALRRAVRSLFPNVERDLDRAHREHRLADTGRGAAAGNAHARGNAMDASAAGNARGGSAADDARGGAAAKAATDDGGNNPFSVPAYAIAAETSQRLVSEKTEKEKHSPAFSPLRDMRAGVGDALQYAAQVFPRSDKADRKFAQAEMAFAVAEDVALAAVFAGRPAFAAAAVVRLAKCFVASPCPAPTDAASLLGLVAAVMPEGEARALALRRAEEILDADAHERARLARGAFAGAEKARSALSTLAATASRKFMEDENSSKTGGKGFAKRALGGKRVQFHETPPSPRAGAALCARAMALCARGDWFAARAAAAAAGALLEKPGASNLRLCDVARCLGAAADAHLGRWESAAASAQAIAHDRECHGEIGPWVLALRLAAKTAAQEYAAAVRLWRDALHRVPFSAVPLGAAAYAAASPSGRKNDKIANVEQRASSSGKSFDTIAEDKPLRTPRPATRKNAARGGVSAHGDGKLTGSRDFPAYVCCRAFAAQALWSAGERAEAIVMLSQVCGDQLTRIRAPAHCLLPAAALAAGETAARACRVGAFEKKIGRRLLLETHAFLERAAETTPFAEALAARLREAAPAGYL